VTVTAVNDFPVANDRIVGTAPDMAVAFTLSATDAEGDTLSYTIVDLPGNGTLGGTPPDLTYTPFEGYLGTDELTFFANDGKGDSNIASVTVSILELPHAVLYLSVAPSANLGGLAVETCDIVAFDGIAFTVFFDGSDVGLSGLDLSAFDVIGAAEILVSFSEPMNHPDIPNAVDDSDILKFTAVQTGPDTAGTFEVYFDGSDVGLTTFDEGVDAVTLLDDGRCVLSVRGSVSVPGVDSANEDLLIFEATSIGDATSGSWSRYFDGSDVALAEGSEDVDGVAVDPSENILLSTVGAFSVSGVSGADEDILVFQPTQLGFSTTGTFSPNLLFDGSSFGVTGNITGFDVPTHTINEAPLAVDDSYSVDEDTVLTVSSGLGVLNDDTDPEDDPLAANEASSPTNGTLILAADGSFNYTPNAEFSGTDVFTYTAFDGTSSSPEATVTLTVNPINDAPSAEGQSVSTPEDTALPVVLVGHDHDSATLTYVVTDPANGMVTGTAPNLLYTPDPDYSGTDSFNFFVNDSESDSNTATITVNVTPVKDPPVALPQTVVTLEDFAVEIVLRGTDADDDPLSYRIADGPTVGRLAGTPPTVIYIPNSDSFGADSFTFIVSDGDDSVPAAVDLTITALNDAPLSTGQTVAVEANRNRSILLTGSDVDGDELTYTVVAPPTHGVLSGTAPNLNYTPEPSYNGPDSFTFHVNDGEFDSTMSTVSIVVLGDGGAMTASPSRSP
jgi:VCBS repeat-containing protein